MDVKTLMQLAREWNDMGWAVQQQAEAVIDGSVPLDDLNPNALRVVRDWLIAATDWDVEGAEELLSDLDDALDREEAK